MSQSSTYLNFNIWTPMRKEWRAFLLAITILLLISNFLTFKFARTPYSYGLHHDVEDQNQNLREKPTTSQETGPAEPSTPTVTSTAQQSLPKPTQILLPAEYQQETDIEPGWCQDRFSTKYLTDLANSQQQYCEAASLGGRLYCYHISVGGDAGTDAFCVSSPTEFKKDENIFVLKCNKNEDIQPSLDTLPSYWYSTGPSALLRQYLDLAPDAIDPPSVPDRRFSILVKREDALNNLWHVLMQIESVLLTLDVMSITMDNKGKPLYTPDDIRNTQVVITDDMEDSIFRDLWQMVGGKPVRRLSDLPGDSSGQAERIVIPLAGKANPMWQGDWSPHLCHRSEIFRVFVNRVLKHFRLQPSHRKDNDKTLVLTWIDRRGQRRLTDQDQHIERIKAKFPDVEIRVVDFAAIPLAAQLKAIQETDILAGVHGAGLTHGMFLSPGATLVEIQPPEVRHRGFRNMAHLVGVQYFTIHADSSDDGTDWHEANVALAAAKFESVIETSIKAMSQSGSRTDDVA